MSGTTLHEPSCVIERNGQYLRVYGRFGEDWTSDANEAWHFSADSKLGQRIAKAVNGAVIPPGTGETK